MELYHVRMLVCLAGFLGSGRKILARKLSKKYGFHYYDVDKKKFHTFVRNARSGSVRERTVRPRTDAERSRIFEHVISDLPLLSKMYKQVVLDDAFHRELPREYFLKEARKYFDRVVLVWIESSEEDAHERLEAMQKRGLIASTKEGVRRRKRAQATFQSFAYTPPTFLYRKSERGAIQKLHALIQDRSI